MRTILLAALALLAFNVALVVLALVWAFFATRNALADGYWTCANTECGATNSLNRKICGECWTLRSGELPYPIARML